jgi:hypothetical protein
MIQMSTEFLPTKPCSYSLALRSSIWLSEPLLSLVDTTVVGQYATTNVLQLAALGPATMLTGFRHLHDLEFLAGAIATTNTVANCWLRPRNESIASCKPPHRKILQIQRTVLGTMISALVFGAG